MIFQQHQGSRDLFRVSLQLLLQIFVRSSVEDFRHGVPRNRRRRLRLRTAASGADRNKPSLERSSLHLGPWSIPRRLLFAHERERSVERRLFGRIILGKQTIITRTALEPAKHRRSAAEDPHSTHSNRTCFCSIGSIFDTVCQPSLAMGFCVLARMSYC